MNMYDDRVESCERHTRMGGKLIRTTVVLDDDLVESALKASGLKTRREAIEEGLRLLINVHHQKRIGAARGALKWSGNLGRMRRDKR